jgi:hypothetical protein
MPAQPSSSHAQSAFVVPGLGPKRYRCAPWRATEPAYACRDLPAASAKAEHHPSHRSGQHRHGARTTWSIEPDRASVRRGCSRTATPIAYDPTTRTPATLRARRPPLTRPSGSPHHQQPTLSSTVHSGSDETFPLPAEGVQSHLIGWLGWRSRGTMALGEGHLPR